MAAAGFIKWGERQAKNFVAKSCACSRSFKLYALVQETSGLENKAHEWGMTLVPVPLLRWRRWSLLHEFTSKQSHHPRSRGRYMHSNLTQIMPLYNFCPVMSRDCNEQLHWEIKKKITKGKLISLVVNPSCAQTAGYSISRDFFHSHLSHQYNRGYYNIACVWRVLRNMVLHCTTDFDKKIKRIITQTIPARWVTPN